MLTDIEGAMDDIDRIPAPTNLNAADDFENLRVLVRRHQQAPAAQPKSHTDLVHEIRSRIEDAQAAELALTSYPTPSSPADLETHNRALLLALESRTAYDLLQQVLERICGSICAPPN